MTTHYQKEVHRLISEAVREAKQGIIDIYAELLNEQVDVSIEIWLHKIDD